VGTAAGTRLLVVLPLAVVSLVHGGRTDARFLLLAGRDPRRVFAAEYALIAVLPVLALLATGQPVAAGGAAGGSLLFAFLPTGGVTRFLRGQGERAPAPLPIAPRAFEWISGVRGEWGGLLLIELGAALASKYPAGPLAAIVALAGWAVLPHLNGEPLLMAEGFGGPPGRFLREKVTRSLALFAAVCAPPAVLYLARHPALWHLMAAALALAALVHAGCVFARYALYRPGRRAAVAVAFTALVLTGAAVVLPVGIFLVWRLRRAALRNLHAWLG
jgi:hypothetical protein